MVPHGHWQTTTFTTALRHDRITAPWFIEGPINSEAFPSLHRNGLVPPLRHGHIAIMHNLGSPKANAVRRAIRAASARLFCPPKYSPDLNPIEQFFALVQNIGPAKPHSEPAMPSTKLSPRASTSSHRLNAPIISQTPDTTKPHLSCSST
jgi:transposase